MGIERAEAIERACRKLGEVYKFRLRVLLGTSGLTPELLMRDELLCALDMAFAALREQQQRELEVVEVVEVVERQLGRRSFVEWLQAVTGEPPNET